MYVCIYLRVHLRLLSIEPKAVDLACCVIVFLYIFLVNEERREKKCNDHRFDYNSASDLLGVGLTQLSAAVKQETKSNSHGVAGIGIELYIYVYKEREKKRRT